MNTKLVSIILAAGMAAAASGCSVNTSGTDASASAAGSGFTIDEHTEKSESCTIDTSDYPQTYLFKEKNGQNNPLLTNIFCADPTSVVYNGRMYVYATNDNQQYLEKGEEDNTYEKIRSLVIISSEDMVNWRFEGYINTGEIAPWITASWAPSIVSREEDGLTHFYLYFSNSGGGVGVLTATDPAGPWTDPLGKNLVDGRTKGLGKCAIPFDPGVCIDENGTGWLTFGGGSKNNKTTDFNPGNARIVKLGADMISLDSDIAKINAPYHFEANELNYINGTYVYTYNTSWEKRVDPEVFKLPETPTICSMCYMTSKTPLDTDSWEYHGYYLKNPGELGMEYGNNHTHMEKFGDSYYLFYHTQILQKERGIDHGFRSVGVDVVDVDESTQTISKCNASRKGVSQLSEFDPFRVNQAEDCYLTDCVYVQEDGRVYSDCSGYSGKNVTVVKGVDFGESVSAFAAKVKGSGAMEIRLDSLDGQSVTSLSVDSEDWKTLTNDAAAGGVHDMFIITSGKVCFDEWQFAK